MPDDALIVPIIVPSASLHFATIKSFGTVQNVIDALVANSEVTSEVLGGLEHYGWALQKIRKEPHGRQWEEEALEALGNGKNALTAHDLLRIGILVGLLPYDTEVSPFLNVPSTAARPERHFSAFPLTSHLHTPTLRLVSLHPFLSLNCSFLRVPEVHDGFQWKLFVSRSSTVQDTIDSIVDELGLTKSLPTPGGGRLEYVLEEVWMYGDTESEYLTRRVHKHEA